MIETVKRVGYKAFGFRVLSEILLPELPLANGINQLDDITVQLADLSEQWTRLSEQQKSFMVKENMVMFKIPDTAIFCIKDGDKILVSPLARGKEDKIRLYLLGSCMGALLMQRKILPIHGSAVAINGKAFAFIGESGAGKSTLATALLNEGYQLLSDDVISITQSRDQIPYVTPSYPQQKLWKESLDGFGLDPLGYRPLFERETKYAIPVPDSFSDVPLPLAGVFELVKTEYGHIGLEPIKKLKRFHTLYSHTYRNTLIPRLGLNEWHFNESAKIIKQIDMFQLQRPVKGFTVNELVKKIISSI
ncbi:aldolase [Neobacillus drentensis]|uniref:aldolase n=1 Tax=Neobacillus drentensis TaxID=220684 RepID=UPI002FFE97F9